MTKDSSTEAGCMATAKRVIHLVVMLDAMQTNDEEEQAGHS